MTTTISFSGPDNIGKTTQISLLSRCDNLHFPTPESSLHGYLLPHLGGVNLKEWWFGCTGRDPASDENFVQAILQACWDRANASKPNSDGITIFDRDGIMFESVCVARIAHNSSISLEDAAKKLQLLMLSFKSKCPSAFPSADIRIMIRWDCDVADSVKASLKFEDEVSDDYRSYQALLQTCLRNQEGRGAYSRIFCVPVQRSTESAVVLHDRICATISEELAALGSPSRPFTSLRPVLESRVCVAFGGLSESGKSTAANDLVKRVTRQGIPAARLKIGYFLDNASRESGVDVYDLPPKAQALALLFQLDRYVRAHHWLRLITLESVHRFDQMDYLHELMGGESGRMFLVYMDAARSARQVRTEQCGLSFDDTKDTIKIGRGADRIRDIADVVVDNNGPLGVALDAVEGAVNSRFRLYSDASVDSRDRLA